MKRLWRRLAILVLAGLLVLGFSTVFRHEAPFAPTEIIVSRETTYLIEPRLADGTVDYFTALESTLSEGVTQESNAAPLILAALGPGGLVGDTSEEILARLGMPPFEKNGRYYMRFEEFLGEQPAGNRATPTTCAGDLGDSDLDRLSRSAWSIRDYPVAAAWLEANADALAVLVAASDRAHFYCPRISSSVPPSLIDSASFGFFHFGDACKALACRAMLRVGMREWDGAWEDALALQKLGRLTEGAGMEVGVWFAWATDEWASQVYIELVKGDQLSEDRLRRMLALLGQVPPPPSYREGFDSRFRLLYLEGAMDVCRSGDPTLVIRQLPPKVTGFDPNLLLRLTTQYHDQVSAALGEEDYAARLAKLQAVTEQQNVQFTEEIAAAAGLRGKIRVIFEGYDARCERLTRLLSVMTMVLVTPRMDHVVAGEARAVAMTRLAKVSLALAVSRGAHGRFPASLADLGLEYPSVSAEDPFLGSPLRYRSSGAGYLLYSVGPDMRDDNGDSNSDDIAVAVTCPIK